MWAIIRVSMFVVLQQSYEWYLWLFIYLYFLKLRCPLLQNHANWQQHFCNMKKWIFYFIITSQGHDRNCYKHCGYWFHGAEATDHQYSHCWLNINCPGPVSYVYITFIVIVWNKNDPVVYGLSDRNYSCHSHPSTTSSLFRNSWRASLTSFNDI